MVEGGGGVKRQGGQGPVDWFSFNIVGTHLVIKHH